MTKTEITVIPDAPQIIITREFDAPAALLFRAFTEPELMAQWLGPRRLTMVVKQFDRRNGGSWRYVHRDTDGSEYGFHGVYHGEPSVEAGVVQTFEFEGAPGHVSMETLTFEEKDGKTVTRVNDVFQSVMDRDMAIQSGMASGIIESHERLDELLARLAKES